jgi:hypothetical protein
LLLLLIFYIFLYSSRDAAGCGEISWEHLKKVIERERNNIFGDTAANSVGQRFPLSKFQAIHNYVNREQKFVFDKYYESYTLTLKQNCRISK